MVIILMDIITPRRGDITGMSVVPGGRDAGGNLVTTGITGRIDIITITGRMDITGLIDTDELGFGSTHRAGSIR
jgi:hypothetical protein